MLVLALGILFLLCLIAWASFTGAPWVPARRYDFAGLLNDSGLKKDERGVELGCGDGRLLKAMANRGARVDGYEINPFLWLVAWLRCLPAKNAHVHFGNLWNVSLQEYDIVVLFLMPRAMSRLSKKATAEMKPGSRLVSYVFALPDKKPIKKGASWYTYKY